MGMDAQLLLDLVPHLLRPGLRPVQGCLQLDLVPDAHLLDGLRDMHQIGGRTQKPGNAEVDHHGNQLLRVACGHGHYRSAHLLRAVMAAQPSGEQAIAVGHLDDVLSAQAGHGDAAGHALAPDIDVPSGIAHHCGLSRGAAGGMDAHDLGVRHGEHPEGIGVPQIVLGGEGKPGQILQPTDVPRLQADGLHLLAVVLHVMVDPVHQLHQPRSLQGLHLVPAHAFFCLVPNHTICTSMPAVCKRCHYFCVLSCKLSCVVPVSVSCHGISYFMGVYLIPFFSCSSDCGSKPMRR